MSINQLDFKPLCNTLPLFISNYVKVTTWKSTGLSSEEIKLPYISLTPEVMWFNEGFKVGLRFNKSISQQKKLTFTYEKIVNRYIKFMN